MNIEISCYHSGLSKINKFNFSEQGVHFGGYISSLEAALRKSEEEIIYNDNIVNEIYIHKCKITIDSDKIHECDDAGCAEEWLKEINFAKKNGYELIKYLNKYEPDINNRYSYIVFKDENVSIEKVETIKPLEAEIIINAPEMINPKSQPKKFKRK